MLILAKRALHPESFIIKVVLGYTNILLLMLVPNFAGDGSYVHNRIQSTSLHDGQSSVSEEEYDEGSALGLCTCHDILLL